MTLQADTDEIRQIEAEAAPSTVRSRLALPGADQGRSATARRMPSTRSVRSSSSSGAGTAQLNVLDGYCRHMGGDLSQGEVKGNEIACPFHDWRWGGDGRCKNVPYARRVPRLARTATWLTLEQDGMLFVWNDPEGNPPPPEAVIPRIEGATSDEWTDWHWYTTVVNSNCREIIDNVVDMAHFFYIHGSLPTYFKNIFEGHVATQYMNSGVRPDLGAPDGPRMLGTTSVASYFGPSFMIDDLTYNYEDGDQKTHPDQLPLSDRREFLCAAVRHHRQEVGDAARRMRRCRPRSVWATSSRWASSRTSRSGRTRRASTIRCCARRTGRSITFGAGTSSSTSTPPTSRRIWSTASNTSSTPPIRARRG